MKTIKSLAELQIGVQLVYLEHGNAEFYEVVMHHPVQARTFVLMRKPDMKFISVPSATLMDSAAWRIDYTSEDVLDYMIHYHEQMARELREHKYKYFKHDGEETPAANEIEQAAEEFSRFATANSVVLKDICVGFKGGVEHEHNRMMALAVEGYVHKEECEVLIAMSELAKYREDEKVKVIIIREETK